MSHRCNLYSWHMCYFYLSMITSWVLLISVGCICYTKSEHCGLWYGMIRTCCNFLVWFHPEMFFLNCCKYLKPFCFGTLLLVWGFIYLPEPYHNIRNSPTHSHLFMHWVLLRFDVLLKLSTPNFGHNSFACVFENFSPPNKKGNVWINQPNIFQSLQNFWSIQNAQEYFKMFHWTIQNLWPLAPWSSQKKKKTPWLHDKSQWLYGSYHKHLEQNKGPMFFKTPFHKCEFIFSPSITSFPMTKINGVAMLIETHSLALQYMHDICAFLTKLHIQSLIW